MKELKYVGKETVRLLGPQIVTGKARYTGDFRLPGMQYGKILRSPYPYAKIEDIRTERAKAYPGVAAVVTWKDVDRSIFITNGYTPPRHHHIMDEYVRFIGDAVALVVAETEDIALEAMELIEVKYKPLKPVFTIEEALDPNAPQLYPELPGNIAPHKNNLNFEVGNIERGFAESDVVVEVDCAIENGQNPLPAEPPVTICWYEDQTYNFIASAAAPAYCHQNVAASLNVPYEQVRITAPAVGGSFGSKLYSGNVQPLVFTAIMARAARCPVMFAYTKEEHLAVHQNRMVTKAHIKLGLKKNGLASAVEMNQIADAGVCASTQEFMLAVGTNTLPILCKTDNKKYDAKVVVTNHMPSGSFRGYGYMESTALVSKAIMEACEKLDIDPVDYLIKNTMKKGDRYHNAMAAPDFWQYNKTSDWSSLVEQTAAAFKWKERFKGWGIPTWVSPDGKRVRGVGVGGAGHSDTGGKPSNANVTLTGLGAVYLSTCMAEFGAGTRDVMVKIVAEELDMPLESIRISEADTGMTPPDFGSTGSRSTYCGGIVAKRACEDVKRKLYAIAHEKYGVPEDDLGFAGGKVYRLSNPREEYLLFPHLLGKVDGVTGCGHFEGVHNSTIFHIQFVEVEVDKELGTFKITDHFGGSDAGVIVNPLPLRNQLQSFFAGIDIACMEETVWDPNDYRVLNPSTIEYKTRTFNDAVPHSHIVLESMKTEDNDYPFGAVGVGEPLLAPGGPAIRMAIYNACGIKLDSYPYSPAKILDALKEKEGR